MNPQDQGDTRARVRQWAGALVPVFVFGVAVWVLHHLLAAHSIDEVLREVRTVPPGAVAAAALLAATSYLVLTGFDWLGLRYAGRPLPWPRMAGVSFLAYAFGHNLSLASVTGGALRYRLYSQQGLGALDVVTVVGFCSLTTGLGIAVWAGLALTTTAAGTAVLHLAHAWAVATGAGLLGAVAAYAAWASLARRPVPLGAGAGLRPPGARIALPQLLLATLELPLAASVLYVLLPAAVAPRLVEFAGVYAVAMLAGIVSQVPGGLGVFEAVVLYAVPDVPAPQLLAALFAYRGVYYLAPLALAAVGYAGTELGRRRETLGRAGRRAGAWLRPVAPQLLGALVLVAGALLLVSGATPALDARLARLRTVLPLPLLELSHLAGSIVGVALLVLARGLFLRLRAAYDLTFWLLAGGVVASLLKGLDVEEAAFLAIVLAVLRTGRGAFTRPAPLAEARFTPPWAASIAIVLVLSVAVGLFAYRHVPYTNDLWWTFAMHGDAPRMLRATLVAGVALGAWLLARLLRPAPPPPLAPGAADLERAAVAIAADVQSGANAALAGDKRLLFHAAGDAFVMYQVSGRSWIALGDPVGPMARHEELVWSFRELVDRYAGHTVFYEVSPRALPLCLDVGLALTKIGEEARVPLADFGLAGSARADLRQAHRRALRDGASVEIVPPEGVPALLPRLRAISDEWLERKGVAEKGFSLGGFDPDYLARFPVAVVRAEGTIGAFANLWSSGDRAELSVDLMRFGLDAPRGAMDFLFVELMLWGREQGYRWFNLGMAPLAGLDGHALAPLPSRFGSLVFRYGEPLYNFAGLRQYKLKFHPHWEPRYLASPGGLKLPQVAYDVATLISGGVRGLVGR